MNLGISKLYCIHMLPLIVVLTPLLNFLLMVGFGQLVN